MGAGSKSRSLAIKAVADVIGAVGYSTAYDYAKDADVITFETQRGTPMATIVVGRDEWVRSDDWTMLIAHHVDLQLTPKAYMMAVSNKDRNIREIVEARRGKGLRQPILQPQDDDPSGVGRAGRQILENEASERLAHVHAWRANHGSRKEPTDDGYPPDMTRSEWLYGTFVYIELQGGAPLVMEYVPNSEDDEQPTALYMLTLNSKNMLKTGLALTRRPRYHSICVMRGMHVVRTHIAEGTHMQADVRVEVDVQTLNAGIKDSTFGIGRSLAEDDLINMMAKASYPQRANKTIVVSKQMYDELVMRNQIQPGSSHMPDGTAVTIAPSTLPIVSVRNQADAYWKYNSQKAVF